jgi:hypothetical protein
VRFGILRTLKINDMQDWQIEILEMGTTPKTQAEYLFQLYLSLMKGNPDLAIECAKIAAIQLFEETENEFWVQVEQEINKL